MQAARKILQRILRRDLYKFVGLCRPQKGEEVDKSVRLVNYFAEKQRGPPRNLFDSRIFFEVSSTSEVQTKSQNVLPKILKSVFVISSLNYYGWKCSSHQTVCYTGSDPNDNRLSKIPCPEMLRQRRADGNSTMSDRTTVSWPLSVKLR